MRRQGPERHGPPPLKEQGDKVSEYFGYQRPHHNAAHVPCLDTDESGRGLGGMHHFDLLNHPDVRAAIRELLRPAER